VNDSQKYGNAFKFYEKKKRENLKKKRDLKNREQKNIKKMKEK